MRRTDSDPPYPAPKPDTLFGPAASLAFLLEAYDFAHGKGHDPWAFAIELHVLLAAGLTPTYIRWLLQQGYLAQAAELTRAGEARRRFHPLANLCLAERGSFVLTDAGAVYART